MGRLFGLLLVVAGLLYPFAVYYGMEHLSPRLFAALLGGLWLARAIWRSRHGRDLSDDAR